MRESGAWVAAGALLGDNRGVLSFTGVEKSYGRIRAVDGLDLSIDRGEVFGLLGPNGAGKTTSVWTAVGLLRPDAGTVRVAGEDPADAGVRRRIGVAPQSIALYDELTARENLRFLGKLQGLRRRALESRVDELLERVGLADRAKHRAGGFSGGMLRRLNLAAALVHGPELVLLDEPTAGGDPQIRHSIFDLVAWLRELGTTVLLTTHYLEEAQRLCDRVAIVDAGRVLELGTVEELIQRHGGGQRVIVDRIAGREELQTAEPMRAIAGVLDDPTTLGVHVERSNLEDVFLALTGRSVRD